MKKNISPEWLSFLTIENRLEVANLIQDLDLVCIRVMKGNMSNVIFSPNRKSRPHSPITSKPTSRVPKKGNKKLIDYD